MLYPFHNNGLGGAQWGAANCHAPHGKYKLDSAKIDGYVVSKGAGGQTKV